MTSVIQDDASIALTPPLPWVAENAMGFVTGIGRHSLSLTYVSTKPKILTSLSIAKTDGSIVRFDGSTAGNLQGNFIPAEGFTSVLSDLRGQLRKVQHIAICQTQDVEASDRFTGFSDLNFLPQTLPELNDDQLDTSVTFLKRRFALPLLITGMTGGVDQGSLINQRLARAAAKFNIPMGVGSQRIALEQPALSSIFAVKQDTPGLFLIANVGAAQLLGSDRVSLCQRAVAMIDADALAIHINVLQECIQVEGDRHFGGLVSAIAAICRTISVPVIVKEVGAGIDLATARRLADAGVSAIDAGGRGGTSWGYIEGLRSADDTTKDLATSFRDWGIPTAYALAGLKRAVPEMPLIATGGIRDGLTAAKAVALGATMVGIGLPLMRAALQGEEQTCAVLEALSRGLKTTMLITGSTRLNQLAGRLTLGLPGREQFLAHMNELRS